jgi:cyclohexa-1,5-dienecarbonyl-CoA hydratase
MPAYKDIQFSVTDRVVRVTLSRAPVNVLTIAMMKEICEAINRVGAMRDVCAIVLQAAPSVRAFSAGVSIEEHRPDTVFQMLEAFHSIFRALDLVSKPVIAVVTGAALGGGCELASFADIVIATPSARFGQPEIKVGVFPPIAAVLLPRIIGEKKAREMLLTGELLGGEEAYKLGLVTHLVSDSEVPTKLEELLNQLRQMSAPALEMTRRALTAASGLSFDEALKRTEALYLNQLMALKDPQEGIEAFIQKRSPNWKHK